MLPIRARELLTPREAAALLGVSRDTNYRLCGYGAVSQLRVGNLIRIRLGDLSGGAKGAARKGEAHRRGSFTTIEGCVFVAGVPS